MVIVSRKLKIGKKYGSLTVQSEIATSKAGRRFICLCKCGKIITVVASNLRSGNSRSCGCSRRKHGFAGSSSDSRETHSLYQCWSGIKQRCYNTNSNHYLNYGGRGISLYRPWLTKPELFIQWVEKNLGPRPKNGSIDRINNNGNYVPGNLRWASSREQMQNRRITVNRELPLGVYKSRNRYIVTVHIGSYTTPEEAEKAYKAALELLYDTL